MEERLSKKGFSPAVIDATVRSLRESGLIDDVALAESLKRNALTHKMLSRAGVRNVLLKRGIPTHIADALLADDITTDIENALKFIGKKAKALERYPPLTVKRRLFGQLARRGYAPEVIMKAFRDNQKKKEDER